MMPANGGSPERTTDCTTPWNTTGGTAGKPIVRATICMKRGNAAGTNATAGGMKTAIAGARIAIGTTTITTATKLILDSTSSAGRPPGTFCFLFSVS